MVKWQEIIAPLTLPTLPKFFKFFKFFIYSIFQQPDDIQVKITTVQCKQKKGQPPVYFQCFSAVCLDLTIFFLFAPVAHIQKGMANLSPSASEASKLLEAALQQMDGIIQGAKFDHVGPVQTSLNSSKGEIFISLKKYFLKNK